MLRKMPIWSVEQLFQRAGSSFQPLSSACSARQGFQRGGVVPMHRDDAAPLKPFEAGCWDIAKGTGYAAPHFTNNILRNMNYKYIFLKQYSLFKGTRTLRKKLTNSIKTI